MNIASANPFLTFWALGYHRLVPIIPPGVEISERSSIFARMKKGEDPRGKTPGVKWPDGRWSGFDWIPHKATERDLDRWCAMGAGIGIQAGHDGVIGIDADAFEVEHARIIKEEIDKRLGPLAIRIGRYPKALYLARCLEPLTYSRVEFGALNEKGTLSSRVEILTERQQFVVHGVHPGTLKPYKWVGGHIPPIEDVPIFPAQTLVDLLQALRERLPAATLVGKSTGREDVDQKTLTGDADTIRRAVACMPNDSKHFATRESYLSVGYALKAALPDDPDDAFDIFRDWCDRWQEGRNDPDTVESDWSRMKPPFRRGASWLLSLAGETTGENFTVDRFFEPIPPDVKGFAFDDNHLALPPAALVKGMIPVDGVCFVGGQSGAGKTFIVVDLAVSLASGCDFFGRRVREKVGVVILAGEGAATINTRLRAAREIKGLEPLPIAWLGAVPNLADVKEVGGLVPRLQDVDRHFRERYGVRLGAVVYDTLAATFSLNDENDNSEAAKIIRTLQAVGRALRCLQIPVHHYGKGAETGLRGASGWRAGCDAVLSVTCNRNQVTGATSDHFLSLSKNRVGEEGPIGPFFLRKISLGVDEDGEAFGSCYVTHGALYETVNRPDTREGEAAALDRLSTGDWKMSKQAGDQWAGRAIAEIYGLDLKQPGTIDFVQNVLKQWRASGQIREIAKMNERRQLRKFIEVVGSTSQNAS